MEEQEIRLTPNMLKTLSEGTRLKILRELSLGPRIPSDISKKLNKSTPTILEHLDKLTRMGFVEKREQHGRKFVFYALTQAGTELVSSKNRVSLALYSSIIIFIIGISFVGAGFYNLSSVPEYAATVQASNVPLSQTLAASINQSYLLGFFGIIILVVALVFWVMYVIKFRQISIRISG
jgi:DNA-binding transcriptional ArsR family regulator